MRTLNTHTENSGLVGNAAKRFMSTTALTAASLVVMAGGAKAQIDPNTVPVNGNVVGGSSTIDQNGTNTNIHQHTQRTVIDWDSFNHGSNAVTRFFQPNQSALAVNRVVGPGQDPTQILGTILANGQIAILDRNGVIFGPGSRVDAASLIASTGHLDKDLVMSGASIESLLDTLKETAGAGSIINEGTLNIAEAGLAAFVGSQVANDGVINAKMGTVVLAAVETTTLDLYGDGLVEVAIDEEVEDKVEASNSGTINAEGGNVIITADVGKRGC